MKSRTICVLAGVAGAMLASPAMANVIWDEAIDGSLSTDRFNTTNMGTLTAGSNDVIGTTVNGISKFFTITIDEGDSWTGLIVESWESYDDLGFLGVVAGDYFSVVPSNPDVTQLMGYVHYGELDVNQDILGAMAQGPGSQGFTTPVGPGTYSFWVRQGGAAPATWDLNFVVESSTVVPGIGGLAGLMGAGLIRRRRR